MTERLIRAYGAQIRIGLGIHGWHAYVKYRGKDLLAIKTEHDVRGVWQARGANWRRVKREGLRAGVRARKTLAPPKPVMY